MSDNLTPSDDSDNLFAHLLDYGQTEEFQQEVAAFQARQREKRREPNRIAQRAYSKRHPEFAKMRAVAKKLKPVLYSEQKGLCFICGEPLCCDYQIDHIVALVNGGTNDRANLCVVHASCNLRKGSR